MITLQNIKDTRNTLPKEVVRTPLLFSEELTRDFGAEIYLKAENLQVTGAYKARAAFHILNSLSPEQKQKGAAISSSGNFAGAFAFMGRLLGISTSIVMMQQTAPFKIEKTRGYGGKVILCENRFEARWETLDQLESEGTTAINTFEAPEVIVGHGTIGLEILQDKPDIDMILVPISSAGLIAGVALSAKEIKPNVKIIGVQPEACNATHLSFQKGSVQTIKDVDTICDALVATKPGTLPFEYVQKYVDDVVLVSEESIKKAVGLLFEKTKLVVEPSGAVGVAALLSKVVSAENGRIVSLLSGGNVSRENFTEFLNTK